MFGKADGLDDLHRAMACQLVWLKNSSLSMDNFMSQDYLKLAVTIHAS